MRTYWNLADGYQTGFSTQPGTWISLSAVAPNADATMQCLESRTQDEVEGAEGGRKPSVFLRLPP